MPVSIYTFCRFARLSPPYRFPFRVALLCFDLCKPRFALQVRSTRGPRASRDNSLALLTLSPFLCAPPPHCFAAFLHCYAYLRLSSLRFALLCINRTAGALLAFIWQLRKLKPNRKISALKPSNSSMRTANVDAHDHATANVNVHLKCHCHCECKCSCARDCEC